MPDQDWPVASDGVRTVLTSDGVQRQFDGDDEEWAKAAEIPGAELRGDILLIDATE